MQESLLSEPRASDASLPVTLVAYGDPGDRGTWSSAPRNLLDALGAAGCDVRPVNALTANKLIKGFQLGFNMLRYGSTDFRRGPVARAYAAKLARRGIDAAGYKNVLHVSLQHMPLPAVRDGERHYLYLDFTYDLRLGSPDRAALTPFQRCVEDLDREAYAQIHHFLACSEYIRDHLIERYGIPAARISVVGSGLSTGFIRPSDHEKDYASGEILFSSKIPGGFNYKGGALLLEAFRIAHAQNPDLHLTIVGHEDYKRLAGGVPGVTALGYVSWEDLQALFDRAALYAMPALQEPWGVVFLEALACKTPILGLDRFAFPEISQHGQYGFACPEATPESIAATLLDAMSDPARLAAMGQAGQAYVLETFSWEKVAGRIVNAIAARG